MIKTLQEELQDKCDSATRLTEAYCKYKNKDCYFISENGDERFTEYAQDIFNQFYNTNDILPL